MRRQRQLQPVGIRRDTVAFRQQSGRRYAAPLAGLATIVAIGLIIALAIGLFRSSFTKTVAVTVLSPRAGLVMNPDAKVKMRGVQVGKVQSIEVLPDGQAALHLAMDPSQLHLIPANVGVDITSSTVFGAKFVQLEAPKDPAPQSIQPGQVLSGQHVLVETNTVFQQLTTLLGRIDPTKLNETLGALSEGLSGRGEQLGKTFTDLDELLATIEPSLPNMTRDIEAVPPVVNAYADAAPDLIKTAQNASTFSDTIVDQQQNLDTLLISAVGLADTGNQVVGDNRQALTDVLQLLTPTTDLLYEYRHALNCTLLGMAPVAKSPPLPDPGILVSVSFTLGVERYRYPGNLPKVAATGGPHCEDVGLPVVGFNEHAPFVVADVGANPAQYGNQGILLNSEGLKNFLFGPLDGPPRNTSQVGQPG
ncbi:MCE family protein [Mycolicibacterium komossense]|uniref:MCE family protein n=1 Tax=Mycolicibacterium komossense TaxID=1779 RepID=A0ABT3CHU2_9MYCO|nr:MCE family protein [Mycolicibacterium komossense]